MIISNFRPAGATLLAYLGSSLNRLSIKRSASMWGTYAPSYSFAKVSLLSTYLSTRHTSIEIRGATVKIEDVLDASHQMLTYFIPPQLQGLSPSSAIHTIQEGDACRMVFLQYAEEEESPVLLESLRTQFGRGEKHFHCRANKYQICCQSPPTARPESR